MHLIDKYEADLERYGKMLSFPKELEREFREDAFNREVRTIRTLITSGSLLWCNYLGLFGE